MERKMEEAINEQIKNELYSAYLYLSMASYFDSINLEGFSHWMKVQAKEEVSHAMKLYDFVFDRGGKVIFKEIPAPPSDFSSPLDVFEKVLQHEKKVTELIEKLYKLSLELNDTACQIMLQWFINEQVEDEKNALKIVERLKMIKESPQGILIIDRELAKREE